MNTSLLTEYCESLELSSERVVLMGTGVNLSTQTYEIPTQRWAIEYTSIDIPVPSGTSLSQARAFSSLIESMRGGAEIFEWSLPSKFVAPQGTADGSMTVSSSTQAGSTTIPVISTQLGVTGLLKAGDFVRFSNQSKLYSLLDDVNPNASGMAELSLNAPLKNELSAGDTVIINGVTIQCRLDPDSTNVISYQADNHDMLSITLNFLEAF